MTPSERDVALAKLSADKQLDIYVAGGLKTEPSFHLNEVALHWRTVVPALKKRLVTSSDDSYRLELLSLLLRISENHCIPNDDLISTGWAAQAKMRGTDAGIGRDDLQRIQRAKLENLLKLPACE